MHLMSICSHKQKSLHLQPANVTWCVCASWHVHSDVRSFQTSKRIRKNQLLSSHQQLCWLSIEQSVFCLLSISSVKDNPFATLEYQVKIEPSIVCWWLGRIVRLELCVVWKKSRKSFCSQKKHFFSPKNYVIVTVLVLVEHFHTKFQAKWLN